MRKEFNFGNLYFMGAVLAHHSKQIEELGKMMLEFWEKREKSKPKISSNQINPEYRESETDLKRYNKLRKWAIRNGFRLHKSRIPDYGIFKLRWVSDPDVVILGEEPEEFDGTLDVIELYFEIIKKLRTWQVKQIMDILPSVKILDGGITSPKDMEA